jgi:hypothetical protein
MNNISGSEVNYAELQKEIDTCPTLATCYRLGNTHAAYGWAPNQQGDWNEQQRIAYLEGYRSYSPNQCL